MNTTVILNELRARRDRIDRAIAALEGLRGKARGQGRRRKMSAAARARIAAAQRARWAKWKKGH